MAWLSPAFSHVSLCIKFSCFDLPAIFNKTSKSHWSRWDCSAGLWGRETQLESRGFKMCLALILSHVRMNPFIPRILSSSDTLAQGSLCPLWGQDVGRCYLEESKLINLDGTCPQTAGSKCWFHHIWICSHIIWVNSPLFIHHPMPIFSIMHAQCLNSQFHAHLLWFFPLFLRFCFLF